MIRYVATLLLVAHMGAFAGPALVSLPGGGAGHDCPIASLHLQPEGVKSPKDCPCCEDHQCDGMITCSVGASAIVADATVVLATSIVAAAEREFNGSQVSFLRTPRPPPPKT
jgi:hypothetical protein